MWGLLRAGVVWFCAMAWLAAGSAQAAPPMADATPRTDSPAFEGRRLWLKLNCYSCHGMHAGGAIAMNIQGFGGEVSYAVHGGFAGFGMPNFSTRLTEADIPNLSAYLNVAGTASEPTFLQWWKVVPGN